MSWELAMTHPHRFSARRLVVKLGTGVLLGTSRKTEGQLDQEVFNNVAAQVVEAQKHCGGCGGVAIVSSGAIQAGQEQAKEFHIDTTHLVREDLAGIGARHLLNRWAAAFHTHNREVCQVWVTTANWKNRRERLTIYFRMLQYINHEKTIPIINENDPVCSQWRGWGVRGNDWLAGMIARRISADGILFLTNVGGVYYRDPDTHPDARMYKTINARSIKKLLRLPFSASSTGTGGMRAKLIEAAKCFRAGMRVSIAGMDDDVIIRFAKGEPVGTTISTSTSFY